MIQDKVGGAPWYKKIEVLQILNDWTQEQAAEMCCTSQKVYWSWIKGKTFPRKNSRKAICLAFGVQEEEIWGAM